VPERVSPETRAVAGALRIPGAHRRVAVLGGLYSNHLGLAAALRDARRREAELVLCLGDVGGFGPHPDRVFPLLREHGVRVMQGNYDVSVARGLSDCGCGYTDPRDNRFARISYDYTLRNTSAANRAWLGGLPVAFRFRLGEVEVGTCHGSPRETNEFLWESGTPDGLLDRFLDALDVTLLLATHTGIKWERRLPGGRGFVNVGVIGRPENDGTPRVWYTLLEAAGQDGWTTAFVPVTYDHEALAAEMRAEGLPEEFMETILTGWWTTCLEVLPARERLRGRY
jgi:diadenosine tetraphosphatase ApaH/serine/threonine PP2A family protein phosphatase